MAEREAAGAARRSARRWPFLHPDAVAVLAGGAALDLVPRARPSSMAAGVVFLSGRRGGGAGGDPPAIS
jgi:hypothetical protein